MKNERQEKILEMVSKYTIETQEELISLLSRLGYEVTQATVSRDIRDLKLSKIMRTSQKSRGLQRAIQKRTLRVDN